MARKILFLDSGVGALSIVNEVRSLCKNLDCLIYIDNGNSPYGDKTTEYLKQNTFNIISSLLGQYDIGLIVLACNTLTVSVIKYLREMLEIPIVGTEPNVNTDLSALVLCTSYTAKNCVLIQKKHFKIVEMPMLAGMIDNNLADLSKVEPYLKVRLSKYKKYNAIILGCTHYNFIKGNIEKVMGKSIEWVENKYGVAKRIMHLIDDSFLTTPNVDIVLSKEDKTFRNNLYAYLENV